MKKRFKFISVLLTLVLALSALAGCTGDLKKKYADSIDKEIRASFDFFWNEAQTDKQSPAYGIVADRWPNSALTYGSIASIGFGLSAVVIGVEEGFITREQGAERALGTLRTLKTLQTDPDSAYEGFFYHFLKMSDGKKYGNCEVSTIDTALLLAGALHAAEYFKGDVEKAANELYAAVNWKAFELTKGNKKYISMGYKPDGGILQGCWDWYAEQLIMYVLGAGSPTAEYRLDKKSYYDFTRRTGEYAGHEYIYSYFGSLFTYQFSHAWLDFRGYKDENGTDWYENSVAASKAAYQYCVDNADLFATYSTTSWGLTACDVKGGYSGYLGTPPRGWSPSADYAKVEGTVAPTAAIGSVVFTPKESLAALKNYQSIDRLNSKYGVMDAYNLDQNWYSEDCIGIDKGVGIVMLYNYKNEGVWNTFMQNGYVQDGLARLGITKE